MERKYREEGMKILRRREKLDLTQVEASDLAGIPFGVYQRYEYGMHSLASSRMKTGLALCVLLDLNPYEFDCPARTVMEADHHEPLLRECLFMFRGWKNGRKCGIVIKS